MNAKPRRLPANDDGGSALGQCPLERCAPQERHCALLRTQSLMPSRPSMVVKVAVGRAIGFSCPPLSANTSVWASVGLRPALTTRRCLQHRRVRYPASAVMRFDGAASTALNGLFLKNRQMARTDVDQSRRGPGCATRWSAELYLFCRARKSRARDSFPSAMRELLCAGTATIALTVSRGRCYKNFHRSSILI